MLQFDFGTNLDEAVNSLRDKLGMVQMMMPDDVGDSTILNSPVMRTKVSLLPSTT